jgi:CheY-like chemotaxis protein
MSIIVADDSFAHRKIIVGVIREVTDEEVIEASNGIEVILKDLSKVSLLICDIIMPQMDGLKLIHYIRIMKKIRDLPIIVISSTAAGAEDIHKIYSMGVSEVIQKPVEKDRLKEILRNYI